MSGKKRKYKEEIPVSFLRRSPRVKSSDSDLPAIRTDSALSRRNQARTEAPLYRDMSLSEVTPRTLLEGVIQGHDTVQTTRKRPRVQMSPEGRPHSRSSLRQQSASKSLSASLRKKATMKNFIQKNNDGPTPRGIIQAYMEGGPSETPVIGTVIVHPGHKHAGSQSFVLDKTRTGLDDGDEDGSFMSYYPHHARDNLKTHNDKSMQHLPRVTIDLPRLSQNIFKDGKLTPASHIVDKRSSFLKKGIQSTSMLTSPSSTHAEMASPAITPEIGREANTTNMQFEMTETCVLPAVNEERSLQDMTRSVTRNLKDMQRSHTDDYENVSAVPEPSLGPLLTDRRKSELLQVEVHHTSSWGDNLSNIGHDHPVMPAEEKPSEEEPSQEHLHEEPSEEPSRDEPSEEPSQDEPSEEPSQEPLEEELSQEEPSEEEGPSDEPLQEPSQEQSSEEKLPDEHLQELSKSQELSQDEPSQDEPSSEPMQEPLQQELSVEDPSVSQHEISHEHTHRENSQDELSARDFMHAVPEEHQSLATASSAQLLKEQIALTSTQSEQLFSEEEDDNNTYNSTGYIPNLRQLKITEILHSPALRLNDTDQPEMNSSLDQLTHNKARAMNEQLQPQPRPSKSQSTKSTKLSSKKKVPRLPRSLTKSIFQHFSKTKRISKEVLDEVEAISDTYWKNTSNDLMVYAHHAHRRGIEYQDVELLMKRQGFITEKRSLFSLVEEYLPMEYRQEIIPIARSGNSSELK